MKLKFLFCVSIVLILCGSSSAQSPVIQLSTSEDLKSDLALASCNGGKERLDAVKKLFVKTGATETEVVVEKIKDVENLVVTKKGDTGETVIIGAHYDKTKAGCGVIDNWTGVVILANLYRAIKDLKTQKTYMFVAFDKEESGLVGSEAMAKKIPKEQRQNYCSMVNFDSFGFAYPQGMGNTSTDSMVDFAKNISDEMKIPFGRAAIEFAGADSESFMTRDIPAITLHGMNDKWPDYLHTSKDVIANVNIQSVYIGFRYGLVFLTKIDAMPCNAFRKIRQQKK
jgi:Zn-dependent M28 family amino/carboxypeptidase